MKKILFLLIFLFSTFLFAEELRGFYGVLIDDKSEVVIKKMENKEHVILIIYEEDINDPGWITMNYYSIDNELTYCGEKVKSIDFYFKKNQLFEIKMSFNNDIDAKKILNLLVEKYNLSKYKHPLDPVEYCTYDMLNNISLRYFKKYIILERYQKIYN